MARNRVLALLLVLVSPTSLLADLGPGEPSIRAGMLARFGMAMALSGDVVLIGEPIGPAGGSVHLFRRTPAGAWREFGKVVSPEAKAGDGFGVNLVVDGPNLMVAAQSDSTRGGVYAFKRNTDGTWSYTGRVGPEKPGALSQFGSIMAVSGDLAAIGARGEAPAGAVHLYRRGSDGVWQDAGSLTPASPLAPGDRYGSALAIAGDRIAVGAPGRDGGKGNIFLFRRSSSGIFAGDSVLSGRQVPANGQLGVSLLFAGDQLISGATFAWANAGMVVVFERNPKNDRWSEKTTLLPIEMGLNRYGTTLTMVGDELWIGAPLNNGGIGAVFRVKKERGGAWGSVSRLTVDTTESTPQFGSSIVVGSNFAAIGMPSDGGGEGTVAFLAKTPTGVWSIKEQFFPPPAAAIAAVTGAEVRCDAGKTKDFECSNTGLLSYLPISQIGGKRGVRLSGMWGWTDPVTGHDIALIGRTDGTAFVDVTDPLRPRYLGDMTRTAGATATSWRELKTYKNFVLVVSDGSGDHHGIQFFDLTHLRNVKTPQHFAEDAHYDLGSIHDIVVNEESGYAYAVGTNQSVENCGGGLHMIDIRDPMHPKFAGCFADKETGRQKTGYTHDAQCVMYKGPDTRYTGHEICMAANETHVSIQDVTDKSNPKVISRASYPNVGYAHQGWFSEDQRYWFFDDELDEMGHLGKAAEGSRTIVWDMKNLEDPVVAREFIGPTKAIDHNQYVKGNRLYQSNYTAGLRILDISDPVNLREVGFLDTYPSDNATGFAGTWSNYPYFKNGSIGVVSMGEGFFLVKDRTVSTVP